MSLSAGRGTPMMPVDEGKTSSKTQPKCSAVAVQERRQASMPGSPVAQLALPELMRTAVTRPPLAARWLRPTMTGAATTWFEVNMAAALAPVGQRASARSGLPLALIPAVADAHWKPRGRLVDGEAGCTRPRWDGGWLTRELYQAGDECVSRCRAPGALPSASSAPSGRRP